MFVCYLFVCWLYFIGWLIGRQLVSYIFKESLRCWDLFLKQSEDVLTSCVFAEAIAQAIIVVGESVTQGFINTNRGYIYTCRHRRGPVNRTAARLCTSNRPYHTRPNYPWIKRSVKRDGNIICCCGSRCTVCAIPKALLLPLPSQFIVRNKQMIQSDVP